MTIWWLPPKVLRKNPTSRLGKCSESGIGDLTPPCRDPFIWCQRVSQDRPGGPAAVREANPVTLPRRSGADDAGHDGVSHGVIDLGPIQRRMSLR